jgi:hypothetical protein
MCRPKLIAREMNAFDAALALIALAHLGADAASFAPALHCIVSHLGEGGRHGPYKAYEWNKMKTPTRILVGGPEVTSAFVLMGLALARRAMMQGKGEDTCPMLSGAKRQTIRWVTRLRR